MIWIGIDPGTHTGLAVWDGDGRRFMLVATVPLWQALQEVASYTQQYGTSAVSVVFEDARQRKWFPQERNNAEYRGRLMGAGAAKRDARIWEEFLTAQRIPFEARKPQAGMTKWDDVGYWQRVTGWNGRSSEHSRDAALLVLGR